MPDWRAYIGRHVRPLAPGGIRYQILRAPLGSCRTWQCTDPAPITRPVPGMDQRLDAYWREGIHLLPVILWGEVYLVEVEAVEVCDG